MNIKYNSNELSLDIEDNDISSWLDGASLYYKLPKDTRPDINPYDIDDCLQTYYKLDNIAGRKSGNDVNEALDNLKVLAGVFNQYSMHVLGMIINESYTEKRDV